VTKPPAPRSVVLDLARFRAIVVPEPDPVAAFAAEELNAVCRLWGLAELPVRSGQPADDGLAIVLAAGSRRTPPRAPFLVPQGYIVEFQARGNLVIHGGDATGVLYGTYAVLEAVGVRFCHPGAEGVVLPSSEPAVGIPLPLAGRPRFPIRIVYAEQRLAETAEDEFTFLARLRINRVRTAHPYSPGLVREAARRGIRIEVGGHEINALLPRDQFARKPECFRCTTSGVRGRRSNDFNACAASAETQRIMERNAERYVRARPGAATYHFWPADIGGGGWCSCPLCKHLTVSDQSVLAANAAARAVRRAEPGAEVPFLSYHDTLDPPEHVEPEANVHVLYAARERCHAHGLGDERCPCNRAYREAFERQLAVFGPARTRFFGYYVDGIMYRHATPPLVEVIARDLDYLAGRRVGSVLCLYTSTRKVDTVEMINLLAFAKLAYAAGPSPREIVADYARTVFGRAGRTAERILRTWEKDLAGGLRQCGFVPSRLLGDLQWPKAGADGFARSYEETLRRLAEVLPSRRGKAAELAREAALPERGRRAAAELVRILDLTAAEARVWAEQVRGQNRRMAYLKNGNIKDLREAEAAFRAGERAAAGAAARFAPARRADMATYRLILGGSVRRELRFFARWCRDEMKRRKEQARREAEERRQSKAPRTGAAK